MPNIHLGVPPKHIILPDTNILWHKDKSVPVNPDFDTFWNEHLDIVHMQLVIPEVVRGEILFQQTTSARKALEQVNSQIDQISAITEERYSHRITDIRIRQRVEQRFDTWLKRKKGKVEPTPLSRIDWEEIIEGSIWRLPPFALDPKNPDNEKGFRDALILQTVSTIVEREGHRIHIAFLCNDYLLRTTVEGRHKSSERFACYESLGEFGSYIKLTREQLTEGFVKAIIARADEKFYQKGDSGCLYIRDSIYEKIRQDYGNAIGNPADIEDLILQSLGPKSEPWHPIESEKIWISKSQFEERKDKNLFRWKTQLVIVKPFSRVRAFTNITEERMNILTFLVTWHSKVKADGRFYSMGLESIKLKTSSFKEPTTDDRRRFGFGGQGA